MFGEFNTRAQRKKLCNKDKLAYKFYFGCKVEDQDKNWAPHIFSTVCNTELTERTRGKRNAMPFSVPMVWREPTNHEYDHFFCMTKITANTKLKTDQK